MDDNEINARVNAILSSQPTSEGDIPGLDGLNALAVKREQRISAWQKFSQVMEAKIRLGQEYRQPKDQIAALLECGVSINPTDLFYNDALAITEVVREQDQFSLGWDITYNCLAASSGDFAPFDPPEGRDYYATREQALIALVGWLNDKMQVSYEILMGNEPGDEIETTCPSCGLPFIVDGDGDIVETFPGDRED